MISFTPISPLVVVTITEPAVASTFVSSIPSASVISILPVVLSALRLSISVCKLMPVLAVAVRVTALTNPPPVILPAVAVRLVLLLSLSTLFTTSISPADEVTEISPLVVFKAPLLPSKSDKVIFPVLLMFKLPSVVIASIVLSGAREMVSA